LVHTTAYGPLCSTTPGASASAFSPPRSAGMPLSGGEETLAITSGPAVAARVV
jgi:hypothetical protein